MGLLAIAASAGSVNPKKQDIEVAKYDSSEFFLSSIATPPPKPENPKLVLSYEVSQYGEWNMDIANAIIMAESSNNPNAENPEWHYDIYGNPICQGSFGAWQLACLHGTENDLKDPVKSMEIAYNLWKKSGWTPWTTYTSGKYLKYLK